MQASSAAKDNNWRENPPHSNTQAHQKGGLGYDQAGGDQWPFIVFQQCLAGDMVLVGAVGCGDQGPGIDDKHLVAPEPFGQHLVGLGR